MKDPTVVELRRQCSKRGLPTSGKRTELVARLQSNKPTTKAPIRNQPTTEAPIRRDLPHSENIQCLIATSIPIDVQDPFEMARESLQNAAEDDPLHEENLHDDTTAITNEHGTFWTRMERDHASLREEFQSMTNELRGVTAELRIKTDQLCAKTDELERLTDQLCVKTDELERATAGFRDFRNRFISTYKRDVLNQIEDSDRNFIKLGNVVVHTGNVKRDAELYNGLNARRDILVFRELYGILPAIAINIGKPLALPSALYLWKVSNLTIDYRPTISVLNQYATIVSDLQLTTTQVFCDRFRDFIAALDERGYTGDYLELNEAPTNEYWAFWKAVKTEVIKTN
ncbi:hypothetical protein ZTR_01428 [Talaromyces verruculosus]|nr:hypothetical protein ZTR_01428 [Talaromyces verruculosus]